MWRSAGAFATSAADGSALGWLWTVAVRRLIDGFHRERRNRIVVQATAEAAEIGVPGADQTLLERTRSGDVGQALATLAPEGVGRVPCSVWPRSSAPPAARSRCSPSCLTCPPPGLAVPAGTEEADARDAEWRALLALPTSEQAHRVAAVRQAGLTCQGNLTEALLGTGA